MMLPSWPVANFFSSHQHVEYHLPLYRYTWFPTQNAENIQNQQAALGVQFSIPVPFWANQVRWDRPKMYCMLHMSTWSFSYPVIPGIWRPIQQLLRGNSARRVAVVLSGFKITLVLSGFTCRARRIRIIRPHGESFSPATASPCCRPMSGYLVSVISSLTWAFCYLGSFLDAFFANTQLSVQKTEGGVGRNRLQPVIVEVKEHHFRLGSLQDKILGWQLQQMLCQLLCAFLSMSATCPKL